MSADEIIAVVRELGLRLELRPDGTPVVRGPMDAEMKAVLTRVLQSHRPEREEIVRRLQATAS